MTQPDQLDWQIIRTLQRDGRSANAGIAKKFNVAEGTVRSRIRKLIEAGILKIAGLINPEFLADHQLVLIGINVSQTKKLERTAQALAKLPQVQTVAITSGRYDLIAQVLVDSNKGTIDFLTSTLARIDGIVSTETFLLLKTYNCWI